jgi:hypothetical protein
MGTFASSSTGIVMACEKRPGPKRSPRTAGIDIKAPGRASDTLADAKDAGHRAGSPAIRPGMKNDQGLDRPWTLSARFQADASTAAVPPCRWRREREHAARGGAYRQSASSAKVAAFIALTWRARRPVWLPAGTRPAK